MEQWPKRETTFFQWREYVPTMWFNLRASSFWTFGYQAIICFKKNNFGRLRKVTSADIAEGFRFHGVKMAHTGHIDPGESPDQSLVMSFYGSVRPFFRFFDAQHGFALIHPLRRYSSQECACNQYGMNSALNQGPMVRGRGGRAKCKRSFCWWRLF